MFEILDKINLNTSWRLPRSQNRHEHLEIKGILLVGRCTHRAMGKAISLDSNLVITSDYQSSFTQDSQKDLWEVAYKEEIFILEWVWNWIFTSTKGQKILSKLFLCDNLFIAGSNDTVTLQLSYTSDILVKNIFQNFQSPRIFKKHNRDIRNCTVQKIWIIPKWDSRVIHQILELEVDNPIIVTFTIPNSFLTELYYLKCIIIWIEPREVLNIVNKELYYILKQVMRLPINYVGNPIYNIDKM